MTIFEIITNQEDETKYPVIDKHFTPIIAVNDSELMIAMPKFLTATTGMDALTHAVEAYVSITAAPITDASAIKAIDALSEKVGTKQRLADLDVTEDKLALRAQNALNDACYLTNPRKASLEEIINIFKARM